MSTSNRLDLQTLGSQPIMPNNLPDHWLVAQALPLAYKNGKQPRLFSK